MVASAPFSLWNATSARMSMSVRASPETTTKVPSKWPARRFTPPAVPSSSSSLFRWTVMPSPPGLLAVGFEEGVCEVVDVHVNLVYAVFREEAEDVADDGGVHDRGEGLRDLAG